MYFTYGQNNSGGLFTGPAKYVIVWASSPALADRAAEDAGCYFDGCEIGMDCGCCGDRWSRSWENGTKTPMIYNKPAKSFTDSYTMDPEVPTVHIVYKSGKTFTSTH